MRAKKLLSEILHTTLSGMGLPYPEKTVIEAPKDKKFGDLAVNCALLLAKETQKPPRELAVSIAGALQQAHACITSVDVAGPGFINVTFSKLFWQETICCIERDKEHFGQSSVGAGQKIQIEFVSANPTGPLHIGHGRGAAVGDSLARLLRFSGYDVHTEYYINDAGRQMRLLGISVWLRVCELTGKNPVFPDDWYKGDYIIDIARQLLVHTPALPQMPENEAIDSCFEFAMSFILEGIKEDLKNFRVHHDIWFSERTLVASGAVEKTFSRLAAAGHSFEQDNALWFRTTALGDDKDRVLRKSDGSLTYFASDIAYHDTKYDRGFERIVDIWGADHHGYIPRMRAAVTALGKTPQSFDVILVQLVNLLKAGEQIAMSTRAGQFETLADVVKEVGTDASRFMFLSRKSDSQLDFDLDLVKQRSMENPVYYVQYAHARICAVFRKAAERGIALGALCAQTDSAALVLTEELRLLQQLDRFEDVVESAALSLAPHHISHYLLELAGELHSYYASHQALGLDDEHVTRARLLLLRSVAQVLKNGLGLLGVDAPESM